MKFFKSVLLLLLCMVSVAAYAQTQKASKSSETQKTHWLSKSLRKAHEEAHRRARRAVFGPRCAYCHETLTPADANRHCPALGSNGICIETPIEQEEQNIASSICPKCHESYSPEEMRGHIPHECQYDETTQQQGKHCIYCGKEIETDFQECTGAEALSKYCTTNCPTCGKDLRDPNNVDNNGSHLCREKAAITVTKETKSERTARPSKAAKKRQSTRANIAANHHHKGEYCIYCGEEIQADFQECTSTEALSKYCTTNCPTCGKDLRNAANVNANGVHHCREKATVTVAAPKK